MGTESRSVGWWRAYEASELECERPSRLHGQGLYGFLRGGGAGLPLPAGDEAPGGADRPGPARLSSVLELCREKGLFRLGYLHEAGAPQRAVRHGHPPA